MERADERLVAEIDGLLSQGQLAPALRATIAACQQPGSRAARLGAAAFAMAGCESSVAGAIDPRLLRCRTHAQVLGRLTDLSDVLSDDLLAASVVLSWSGTATEVSAALRDAHARATTEQRYHIAVAALERLAHYALLFGDTMQARAAIEDALALAISQGLETWRLRCAARAAQFALDTDDLNRAVELLDDARAVEDAELLALFAPAGVYSAFLLGDENGIRLWSSQAIMETALHSQAPRPAVAAATAYLLATPSPRVLDSVAALALRRTLARTPNATEAVEFFTLVARCGDEDEARLAVDSLRAVFSPQRRYVDAHYRLARAHLLARTGDRNGAIDSAGDAARAFDSMGLRRWTNEAMLLLVRQDDFAEPEPTLRRRPTAVSLTQREQQVAHLIGRGASNREVARALQISEHTVERHVSSILSRLGLRSRWQIVDAHHNGSEY